MKKGNSAQQKAHADFLEKERLANATRKQDISHLDYIQIPLDCIIDRTYSKAEEIIFQLSEKPMLNLTGISNTDLKLTYGAQNLTQLSEYDTNFLEFVSILPEYTLELIENGQTQTALTLLEFAISCRADSKKIYLQLAELYNAQQATDKLVALYESTHELTDFAKASIQKELKNYLP